MWCRSRREAARKLGDGRQSESYTQFIDDFKIALEIFRTFNQKNPQRKILLLPVWLDFYLALPYGVNGGTGRADLISDPKKRLHFLRTVLVEFLKASVGFEDDIWAWEVMNEPVWTVLTFNKWAVPQGALPVWYPHVDRVSLHSFLTEALAIIEAHGFQSTVGHRFFDDLAYYPTGTFPQYHYYAQNYGRIPTAPYTSAADPPEMPEASAYPNACVGEIGTGGHGNLWPELNGADATVAYCTYARLKALEAKGHRIVFVWPSCNDSEAKDVDSRDALHLGREQCESLAKYTGGVVPATL